MENNGLAISEYEPNAKPHLWKFPQRNKIVASLASLGVLVVEAGEGSGSLVTAKLAKKMGKQVYAVPGPINSRVSVGCNELIKSGNAKMALNVKDILGNRVQVTVNSEIQVPKNMNDMENKIYKCLEQEPVEIDEIAHKIGENIIEIGSTLSIMDIIFRKGPWVENLFTPKRFFEMGEAKPRFIREAFIINSFKIKNFTIIIFSP